MLREAAIAAAVAGVLGLCAGAAAAWAFYSPRIKLAEERAERLMDDVADQNDALDDLRRKSAARAAAAKKAVDAAQAAAQSSQARARDLLARQMPPGVTECAATEALFREVLKR